MWNYIEGVLLDRNVNSESIILICGHYKTGMCLACLKESGTLYLHLYQNIFMPLMSHKIYFLSEMDASEVLHEQEKFKAHLKKKYTTLK